jgi:glycosyltransferase involved in cell wall biosynthesis
MNTAAPRVVMLLGNDLAHDSRVQREAQALARAGYQVTVVARLGDRPLPQEERLGAVRVLRAAYLTRTWHRLRLPILRKAYTLATLLRYGYPQSEFCRLAAAQPADVVHAHDREMLRLGVRLARLHRARLIYDAHELHPALVNERHRPGLSAWAIGQVLRRIDEHTERRLIHFADGTITVNESIATAMAATFRIPPPTVVMNCPDVTALAPTPLLREHARLPADGVAILYQGLLAVGRGLPQLVHSIALLPGQYHLIFLGYGPLEGMLRGLVAAQGLEARVHFLPAVPPAELLAWTAAADLGVATIEALNESKRFATPNKLFEYLMAGLPVVASDLPEIRRIMERAQAGRLIDSVDPATIAAAIRAVVESPDYERYRRQSRAAALERYNWDVEARHLLALYAQVLAAPPRAAAQRAGAGRRR